MKCNTCRWWAAHVWAREGLWLHAEGFRECQNEKLRAVAHGEGVEMDGVLTAPDFGCVQWEARLLEAKYDTAGTLVTF